MRDFMAGAVAICVYALALYFALEMVRHLDEVSRIQLAESRYDSAEGRADTALKQMLESLSLGWYEGAQRQREARAQLESRRNAHVDKAREASLRLALTGACFLLLQLLLSFARRRTHPRAFARPFIAHLIATAFICLLLSLIVPALSFSLEKEVQWLGRVVIQHETHNVLGTVGALVAAGNSLWAVALLAFCVVLPSLKLGAAFLGLVAPADGALGGLNRFLAAAGRWSMLDVLVIGLVIAYLALDRTSFANAEPGPAIYFYAAYSVASLVAGFMLSSHRARLAGTG